jgi:hypothetical protein
MVSVPFQGVFLALLLLYGAYSIGAGLNPRWPLYGALLVLVAAAVADGVRATDAANGLALDVVFLLIAGVGLTAFDRWRPRTRSAASAPSPNPPGADPSQQLQAAAEHPLHDLQGEAVAVVHAPREQDDQNEESGDPQPGQR